MPVDISLMLRPPGKEQFHQIYWPEAESCCTSRKTNIKSGDAPQFEQLVSASGRTRTFKIES